MTFPRAALLMLLAFGLVVLVARSRPGPGPASRVSTAEVDAGHDPARTPPAPASVENRLRAMEGHLVELRNRVEAIEEGY